MLLNLTPPGSWWTRTCFMSLTGGVKMLCQVAWINTKRQPGQELISSHSCLSKPLLCRVQFRCPLLLRRRNGVRPELGESGSCLFLGTRHQVTVIISSRRDTSMAQATANQEQPDSGNIRAWLIGQLQFLLWRYLLSWWRPPPAGPERPRRQFG